MYVGTTVFWNARARKVLVFVGPPPSNHAGQTQARPEHKDGAKPTIQAASTVVKMPRADQDKTVTSMVPASLRVRREAAAAAKPRRPLVTAAPSAAPSIGDGFGLAPQPTAPAASQRRPVAASSAFDKKYEDFMQEMAGLGALET